MWPDLVPSAITDQYESLVFTSEAEKARGFGVASATASTNLGTQTAASSNQAAKRITEVQAADISWFNSRKADRNADQEEKCVNRSECGSSFRIFISGWLPSECSSIDQVSDGDMQQL